MKTKKFSTIIAALLITGMFLSTGCSKSGPSQAAVTSSTGEAAASSAAKSEITLTFRGNDTIAVPGIQNNDVMNEIKNRLGIQINYVIADPTKDKVTLASGDLPDIVQVKVNDLGTYIKGNHIIPLDDLINQYGPDIMQNVPKMLEFSKQNLSDGTNKIYGLTAGNYVNKGTTPVYSYSFGALVRWDYYKELGYPDITNLDDYLKVIKTMQEKHPKTTDGKPAYGFSGWTDWGLWAYYVPYAFSHGWMNGDNDIYLFDASGNIQPTLSEGGIFKEALQFMNKAYRMGLCDPEMFTQKNSDFLAKNKNLQLLTLPTNWWSGDAQKTMLSQGIKDGGFYLLPQLTPVTWENYGSPIAGGLSDRVYTISKNCKNPDRAMQLINFLFSFDGNKLLRNGIQGKQWDMENGKPEYTDETLKAMQSDPQFIQRTGIGAYYNNMCGLSGESKDNNGEYLALNFTDKAIKFSVTEADKDYNTHFGVSYPGEAFVKAQEQGKTKIEFFDNTWQSLMPDQPNDMKMISGKIVNYQLSWVAKCIMSGTEADFEKNWKQGVSEMNNMGYDKLYAWIEANNKIAVEKLKALK
jgi:putative aldouronate transport system substrate-binding protein